MDAIIYTTNTGTTAHYAELLGQKLDLPVFSGDEAKTSVPAGSEVIYFGWIMASEVKGYKAAARRYTVRAVCGVGMGGTGTQIDEVRKKNAVPNGTPVFTLQGGFDIKKLHGVYKLMMETMSKTSGKALAEKPDRTPEEDDMLEMMLHGRDCVSMENLETVLDWYEGSSLSRK